MVGDADDVAGIGVFSGFAVAGQKQHRIVQVDLFAAANMAQLHAPLEVSG